MSEDWLDKYESYPRDCECLIGCETPACCKEERRCLWRDGQDEVARQPREWAP